MSDNKLSETATAYTGASATSPTAAAAAPQPQCRASPLIPYSQILEMFNQLCQATGLRPIQSIKGKRKTQTAARFKEYELSGFFDLFEKVATSNFLCGGGNRGWGAHFDWLIDPANMQKVLEGKYDNDQCNTPQSQMRINGAGLRRL